MCRVVRKQADLSSGTHIASRQLASSVAGAFPVSTPQTWTFTPTHHICFFPMRPSVLANRYFVRLFAWEENAHIQLKPKKSLSDIANILTSPTSRAIQFDTRRFSLRLGLQALTILKRKKRICSALRRNHILECL